MAPGFLSLVTGGYGLLPLLVEEHPHAAPLCSSHGKVVLCWSLLTAQLCPFLVGLAPFSLRSEFISGVVLVLGCVSGVGSHTELLHTPLSVAQHGVLYSGSMGKYQLPMCCCLLLVLVGGAM